MPPAFTMPAAAHIFANLDSDWTLVGSGDFAGEAAAGGGMGPPPPPDGRPDLIFWNAAERRFSVWVSTGAGSFPLEQRYDIVVTDTVPVDPAWQPAVVANIDGQGLPEVIWFDPIGSRLAFSRIVQGVSGPESAPGGPLDPQTVPTPDWKLRAADDFDGDGRDDLILQHEKSEQSEVWFMDGAGRRESAPFSPSRLAPPSSPVPNLPAKTFTIIGPR
jgi:hypothetical protein